MKIKSLILTIIIVGIVFTFSNCANKNVTSISLNIPDKINMYADGKQKQITKSGSEFDKTLLNRVTDLVNVRMPQNFSAMKSEISDTDIKEFKEYAVEFLYDKVQTTTVDNREVKFYEVVFPLGERWQNTALIKTTNNIYEGVGIKEDLNYLVKAAIK